MDWSVPRGLRPHPSCKKNFLQRSDAVSKLNKKQVISPPLLAIASSKQNTTRSGRGQCRTRRPGRRVELEAPGRWGKAGSLPGLPHHSTWLSSPPWGTDGRGDSVPTLHTTACLSSEEEFEEGVKSFPKVCRNTEVLKIFLPLLNLLGQPGHLPPSLTVPSTPCLPNLVLASPPPSLVSAWPLPGMPFAFPSLSKPPLCPGLC